MLRRRALSILAGAAAVRAETALGRFLDSANGSAVLVDVRSRRLVAVHDADGAAKFLAPPGSTIKPFALAALLKAGKIAANESLPCPGRLRIGERSLNCSHPVIDAPMHVDTAIAYSCNCFVARLAERFGPGELARALEAMGLIAPTSLFASEAAGRVLAARTTDAARLQAIGEDGISVTLAELALAYRGLAVDAQRGPTQTILAGLEGAVEFGTAQRAQVAGVKVAGKTGSVLFGGAPIAWFAGFAPSRAPEVVVAVMLQGRSGGADAAPIGGRILESWHAGRL